MILSKPELLIPVANLQKANFAIEFGADSIYAGTNQFGLRYNKNFANLKELTKISKFVHSKNKKIYITTNIFMHNQDIKSFEQSLDKILYVDPDALIVSDLGALKLILDKREKLNNINPFEVHISTQANTTNFMSALFYESLGIDRIILARELTLKEIFEIKNQLKSKKSDLKLETFVHGAMCISYSGRCLLSLYMTSPETSTPDKNKTYRDANRGMCTHPCRWEYKIIEKKRDDEVFEAIEDNGYTYIMSSKDLNLLKYIPLLILSGIDSFKVEGRMKSNHYISATTLAYRYAIDEAFSLLKYKFNKIQNLKKYNIKNNNKNDINNDKYNYDNLNIQVNRNSDTIDNKLFVEDEIIKRYINEPEEFFNDFPEWNKFYNNIYELVDNFSHRPYTTGFYFIKSRKDKALSASSNKYIEKMKYIGFSVKNLYPEIIAKDSKINSISNRLSDLKLNLSSKEREKLIKIIQNLNFYNMEQSNEDYEKRLNNSFEKNDFLENLTLFKKEIFKFYETHNKKIYIILFFAKNKFLTTNNLIILEPDNSNKNPYKKLLPENFLIYDLNLEKVEFTKHSNYYLLITDKIINELSVLLHNK